MNQREIAECVDILTQMTTSGTVQWSSSGGHGMNSRAFSVMLDGTRITLNNHGGLIFQSGNSEYSAVGNWPELRSAIQKAESHDLPPVIETFLKGLKPNPELFINDALEIAHSISVGKMERAKLKNRKPTGTS